MHVSLILEQKGHDVVTVGPTRTAAHAASLLQVHGIGALLVRSEDGGDVLGVLSERDIVRGLVSYGQSCLGLPVSQLMTAEVIACRPDDSITDVMTTMTERRIRHLPVMDGYALVGILSIGDVVKHRLGEIENEAQLLRDYIATA